jgi:uncharacterized FlaG/YvyC family protein
MQIDALNRILPVIPGDAAPMSQETIDTVRQVVAGIRAMNRTQSLGTDRELAFAFDEQVRRVLIQIKDRNTGEVVREIPLKEILEMMKQIKGQKRAKAEQ